LATAQRLSLRARCHTLEGSVPFPIPNNRFERAVLIPKSCHS
jgi:hypothetical protein